MTSPSKSRLTPKLRFPEFRDEPGWIEKCLQEAISPMVREKLKPAVPYTGLGIRSHGKGTFVKADEDPKKNAMDYLYEVKTDDLIVNITFAWEGAIAIARPKDDGALVSHRFPTYTFNRDVAIPEFFQHIISSNKFVYKLGVISPGGAGRNRVLNKNDFIKIKTFIPKVDEQQKIADCLRSINDRIDAESQKLDALKAHKKGLMEQLFPREGETLPRLRFSEFSNAPEWDVKAVDELIKTLTPPKRLPTSEYRAEGEFPIIDQSQNYICGWTNDSEAVIDEGHPVVVFGDHTCALKFVDRPFVQGADGIKILNAKVEIDIAFLFYALQANPVVQEAYKRHFSMLREKIVAYPNVKSGEQQRIATCLTTLDDLITAQSAILGALIKHEKGLMQQLFPSPAEAEA
jgi:type I restriction enzyme S subunit